MRAKHATRPACCESKVRNGLTVDRNGLTVIAPAAGPPHFMISRQSYHLQPFRGVVRRRMNWTLDKVDLNTGLVVPVGSKASDSGRNKEKTRPRLNEAK